jgi:uncharacterized membrane protein YfcA
MSFARVVVGWLVVVVIFLAWHEAGFRRGRSAHGKDGPGIGHQRPPVWPILVEAALLTLLAALWFGSLGSGGGYILFPLVGTLIELPGRLRHRAAGGAIAWTAAIAGILRIAIPGILLGFILA